VTQHPHSSSSEDQIGPFAEDGLFTTPALSEDMVF